VTARAAPVDPADGPAPRPAASTPVPGPTPAPPAAAGPPTAGQPACAPPDAAQFRQAVDQQVTVLREGYAPAAMAAALDFGDQFNTAGVRQFLSQFRADAGVSDDPVERVLADLVAFGSLRVAQLHARATEAQQADHIKLYLGAAARLTGETAKMALALKAYRAGPAPRRRPAAAATHDPGLAAGPTAAPNGPDARPMGPEAPADGTCSMGDTLLAPVTLFEFVQDRLAGDRKERDGKGGPPGNRGAPQRAPDGEFPLVEQDRLFLRVTSKPRRLQAPVSEDEAVALARNFGDAFRAVWATIPPEDRGCLFDYWRGQRPLPWNFNEGPPPRRVPDIQVQVDADPGPLPDALCKGLGWQLIFPVALVGDEPERMRGEIIRVLMQVHRYASGRHWQLQSELVDEPLAAWEKAQGDHVSEAARERKLAALGRAFLRAHDAEVAQLLRRWQAGQSPPVTASRRAGGRPGKA
jgi:hypothetical protein